MEDKNKFIKKIISELEDYRLDQWQIYINYRNMLIFCFIFFFISFSLISFSYIFFFILLLSPFFIVYLDNKKNNIQLDVKRNIKNKLLEYLFVKQYSYNIFKEKTLSLKEHKIKELLYPKINIKEEIFSYKLLKNNKSLKITYTGYYYKIKGHRSTIFKGLIIKKTFSNNILNGTFFGASKNDNLESPKFLKTIGNILNIQNIVINNTKLNRQILDDYKFDSHYEYFSNIDTKLCLNKEILDIFNTLDSINNAFGTSIQFIIKNNTLTIYLADYYNNLNLKDSFLIYDNLEKPLINNDLYKNTIEQLNAIELLNNCE